MALVIDLAARARQLSDEEFRAWAHGQTAFISSAMGELAQERAAVADALERLGFTVRWFEEFGGRDDAAAYLGEVRSCTVYVGLLGEQYGSMLPSEPYAGFSATHAEYLEARAAGKRISFWALQPAEAREGHARRFLSEVQLFHVTGSFAGADDLAAKVERRRREIAAMICRPGLSSAMLSYERCASLLALTSFASKPGSSMTTLFTRLMSWPERGNGARAP
jgi:hypothetical protein